MESQDFAVNQDSSVANIQDEYVGVKGWLLLFCIILTIVIPAIGVWVFVRDLMHVEYSMDPVVKSYIMWRNTIWCVFSIYGFFIGKSLWRKRQDTLKSAKTYLLIMVFCSIFLIVLAILMKAPDNLKNPLLGEAIFYGIRNIILAAIWGFYLKVSKRVKATASRFVM